MSREAMHQVFFEAKERAKKTIHDPELQRPVIAALDALLFVTVTTSVGTPITVTPSAKATAPVTEVGTAQTKGEGLDDSQDPYKAKPKIANIPSPFGEAPALHNTPERPVVNDGQSVEDGSKPTA